MSLLIKGMEMPKNCKECPFSDHEAWCLIPGDWHKRYYCPEDEVSEHCPLVEIKECEDAVSRADVIELTENSYYNLAESIDTWAMVADIERLPPVTPKSVEKETEKTLTNLDWFKNMDAMTFAYYLSAFHPTVVNNWLEKNGLGRIKNSFDDFEGLDEEDAIEMWLNAEYEPWQGEETFEP